MHNQITFREESSYLEQLLSTNRSPRTLTFSPRHSSPRIVQQIILDPTGDSPIKKRILNIEGDISEQLLQRLDERFIQTEGILRAKVDKSSEKKSNSEVKVISPSKRGFQKSSAKELKDPVKPFLNQYVQKFKDRKKQSDQLIKQYLTNKKKLDSLIASHKSTQIL